MCEQMCLGDLGFYKSNLLNVIFKFKIQEFKKKSLRKRNLFSTSSKVI